MMMFNSRLLLFLSFYHLRWRGSWGERLIYIFFTFFPWKTLRASLNFWKCSKISEIIDAQYLALLLTSGFFSLEFCAMKKKSHDLTDI
jgi:hypothetical protein